MAVTMARRSWCAPNELRSVESRSGSMGNTRAAVYTEVVLRCACRSMAEPLCTSASTSAMATDTVHPLPDGSQQLS